MKKSLSYALLTLSIIGLNTFPARAFDNVLEVSETQVETAVGEQWCVWFPHLGEICIDL